MERAKAAVLLLSFVAGLAWSESAHCNVAYYKELGCAPVYGEDPKCPQYYDCPEFHPDTSKCYYKGQSYENGEDLPQDTVTNPCSLSCYCSVTKLKSNGDKGANTFETTFNCASVDCVEVFSRGDNTDEKCVTTYNNLTDCCSSNEICGKDDIDKLSTCEVDSQTYREGQQFYPPNTCQVCICTKDFNGTFEGATYCKDLDCGIEIHNQMELVDKCAPVLFGDDSCCPHKFECPDNSTQVIRSPDAAKLISNDAQCQFGNMTLRIGDELTAQDKCTKCSCEMPPLVTCVQQKGCSNN